MADRDFKDLTRRTGLDKVLHDKAYDIAKNLKYDVYHCGPDAMVYQFFDKNSYGGAIESEIMPNQHPSDLTTQQLAEELPKPIIRKFKKQKVHSSFKDNVWGTHLADMHVVSKYKRFWFLL